MGNVFDIIKDLLTPEELDELKAELNADLRATLNGELLAAKNALKENAALRISLRNMGRHILNVLAHYGIKGGEEPEEGEEKKEEAKPVMPENAAPKEGRHRIPVAPGTEPGVGAVPHMPPRNEILARKAGIESALHLAGKRGMTVKQIVLYLGKIGFPVDSPYYATPSAGRTATDTRLHVAVRNDLYRWKLSGKVTVVEREVWRLTGKG